MRVFIAEKKSMAQALADSIGVKSNEKGYFDCGDTKVTWAMGHLLEQEEPDAYISADCPRNKKGKAMWRAEDLPIIPDKWISKPIADKKAQLAIIGKLLKKATTVVNAGDCDREGQSLIDNVIDYHKCTKPVKRFWVSAADPTSIQRGLENLMDNQDYSGWRDASIARSRADWLIGMNCTRAMTLEAKENNINLLLVTGRVQSPTLSLVVDRDRTIANFKPLDHYGIMAMVEHENGVFKAEWVAGEHSAGQDSEGRLIDQSVASELISKIKGSTGIISDYESKEKSTPPPLGLSLAQVTLIAANKFGYTSEQVLKTCQSLYERKILSYPRTDNSYIPETQYPDRETVIEAIKKTLPHLMPIFKYIDLNRKSKAFSSAKCSAHHAIAPTVLNAGYTTLSEIEQRIYTIVGSNYLSQFLPDEKYKTTVINLILNEESFVAKGRTVIDLGWKQLYSKIDDENKEPTLPIVTNGDPVTASDVKGVAKKTKPPSKFNEGTLIAAMENVHKYVDNEDVKKLLKSGDGIGTPSSRSTVISELRRREYLTLQGKSIVSTPLGQALIDNMPKRLTSATLTALYERELMAIQETGNGLEPFVESQANLINQLMGEIELDVEKLRPFSQKKKTTTRRKTKSKRKVSR